METELSGLLKSLLNTQHLRLVRIGLDTPSPVLDQIVRYETVHRVRDSQDLERRMADDRRCYAFFHPALPTEPLIFTELALTNGMSSNAQSLLDPDSEVADPSSCTCAIFYSINGCHEGLRGVPLGNALISQVADELRTALPGLDTFATLSPIPGFRSWLTTLAQSRSGGAATGRAAAALAMLERSDWYEDLNTSAELERQLMTTLRVLPAPREARRRPRRSGRPVPFAQRRPSRADQLAERYLCRRHAARRRPDGQLPLSLLQARAYF